MAEEQSIRSERLRRLSREGLWIVFSQVAVVAGSLFGVRLLTKLLHPAAYGELALGMTLFTLLGQTVVGPLGAGATRFYAPAAEKGQLGGYLGGVRRLLDRIAGFILLSMVVVAVVLGVTGQRRWIGLIVATLVFALLNGYNAVLGGIQMAARQRSVVAIHQAVEPWARFLVAAALVAWVSATSTMAMLGYAIATIPVLASQFHFFRRAIPGELPVRGEEGCWGPRILGYAWPFAAWGVFTWSRLASDRLVLGYGSTTETVGLYAVLYQLGYYPISLATGMATQFLTPIFFQRAGDATDTERAAGVHRLSWRLSGLAMGVTVVAVVLALLLHAQVFRLLVAPEYGAVSHLLPWMMLAGGTFAAGEAIALSLMSQMRTQEMIAPKIITAALGVGFNIAGAFWFKMAGVVGAAVLFSAVYLAWMAVLARRATYLPIRSKIAS